MNEDEMNQIIEWIGNGENFNSLDIRDKFAVMNAYATLCETIKPIVIKNIASSKQQTFLFKL